MAMDIIHSPWTSANRLKLNTDKTELVWTGYKHNLASAGCSNLSLKLGDDVIRPSDHVRLFGVTFAEDLCLNRHL